MIQTNFFVLLLASVAMTKEIPAMQCERDSDCSDDGDSYYCLSSMCERCIPCEQIFNRHSPLTASGQPGCARTEIDCGVCLSGFQSEDLANQRYSIKCYPVTTKSDYQQPADVHSADSTGISVGAALTFIVIGIFLLAAGGRFIYVKHRRVVTDEPAGSSRESENRKLVDRLPPPYNDPEESEEVCGVVRTSQPRFTQVIVQPDCLNQATPINHCHHHPMMDSSDVDEENGILTGLGEHESNIVQEDGNGSTETIPSLWEPNSTLDLRMDISDDLERQCSAPQMETQSQLIRSHSLEVLVRRPASHGPLTSGRSDPMLSVQSRRRQSSGGERYAHRHVRLSMHRLPVVPVPSPANEDSCVDPSPDLPQHSTSTDQCQEDCEPNEPQAFLFDDSQISNPSLSYGNDFHSSILSFTGSLFGHQISSSTPTSSETSRGSQDSGFFDRSRRRPADDESNFGVALFVKRPREFE